MFYFLTSMVNGRPDVQIRGYVFLFYSVSSKKKVEPKVAWKLIQLRHALPCRPVTSHFCLRDAAAMRFFSILYSIWYRLSPSYARVRVRLHYGTHYSFAVCHHWWKFCHVLWDSDVWSSTLQALIQNAVPNYKTLAYRWSVFQQTKQESQAWCFMKSGYSKE